MSIIKFPGKPDKDASWQRVVDAFQNPNMPPDAHWTAFADYIQETFKESLGPVAARSITEAVVKRLKTHLLALKARGASHEEILSEYRAGWGAFLKEELQKRGLFLTEPGPMT